MKTFTPAQRATIYLKAAKRIDNYKSYCCCLAICRVIKANNNKAVARENFPELYLFEQYNQFDPYWWTYPSSQTREDRNERVLGLLLSREIALNP